MNPISSAQRKKQSSLHPRCSLDLNVKRGSHAASLSELVGLTLAVSGGRRGLNLDTGEAEVAKGCGAPLNADIESLAKQLASGDDVLGREYCRIKSAEDRREHGATFTPDAIIESMLAWAASNIAPEMIVDPGAGSARYAIAAARRFPEAKVVAVEIDPILRIIAKARIKALGLGNQVTVESASFLDFKRPSAKGPVLYIGNPPYVRHHDISPADKMAYADRCEGLGVASSGLSGLHIHFMVKVFELAKPGDAMSFITAAEWLDTNYGRSPRQLLASGRHEVFVGSFAKDDLVFEDALASAVISCINFGKPATTIKFDLLSCEKKLELGKGKKIPTDVAKDSPSWNGQMQNAKPKPRGGMTLGDLFRVSRGMVTGMNDVWIVSATTPKLPDRFLHPCITNSEDITSLANRRLTNKDRLRKLVNLPERFESATPTEKRAIEQFLKWAKEKGADSTFTAKHRKCWWRLDIKEPPPIVMTYMGRRPPVFARNIAGAPLLNIAHGLYPKVELTEQEQDALVAWLNENVATDSGRSYAGGLVKFEPKEAMRIPMPDMKTIIMENNK